MKGQVSSALLLLCLCVAEGAAVSQKPPAQRTVAVVVADAHTEPSQPVPTVRISLGYLDGSVLVTEARDVTNPKGQAWLDVSEDAAQRGGLRIQIEGASGLVIYQPADGQLGALPTTISVSMLPKGSPALLGPAQIQAMLHRMSLQISSLQKKNVALAGQANSTQADTEQASAAPAQKPDLGAAVAEWAQTNGFSSADANKQVQQWAEEIQKQSGGATAEQKALAELALNHYSNAAQLFDEAGNADRQAINAEDAQEQALAAQEKALQAQVQALQAAQQSLLDKLRTPMRELLDHSQQAAGAYRLNGQYHEATQTLESAATSIDAEYNKFPDDKGFHELWLEAVGDAADARHARGRRRSRQRELSRCSNNPPTITSRWRANTLCWEIARRQPRHKTGSALLSRRRARGSSGDKSAALARSGGAGVSQRPRGAYQSRSAPGLGRDRDQSRKRAGG